MLVIIGTYRRREYVERALESIRWNVAGVSETVFVDDSGSPEHSAWLRQFGEVIETGGRGYNAAMQAVVARASGERFVFWEEDFTATEAIDLEAIALLLDTRPHLAQIALLRQPWFSIERKQGGVIEALQSRGHIFTERAGLIEHTATFTCNPAVWAGVASSSWPTGDWSEDRKRDELIAAGYRFAYLPGVRVNHDGVRSGHGY